jgi:NAD dependent epimerase/dehydratase family enzyme
MSALLLDGPNAVPSAAIAAGYRFRQSTQQSALDDLTER